MKKTLIMLFISTFALKGLSQEKKPVFRFKSESISLNKIPQGNPVTTTFEFTNSGKTPLIITAVKPTCGCTAAEYTNIPVKPGKTGYIKITYNAATFGPFNKTIAVSSNSNEPLKTISITGEVLKRE